MKAECSDGSLDRVCPRYVNFSTFSISSFLREAKDVELIMSLAALKQIVFVLRMDIANPNI